ncbi:MAG: cytochrome C biogenesis protein [Bacteroidetes bacterium]|nr:MAG: cytochrome C biogenesis protein [Bacteroidota bacterium]
MKKTHIVGILIIAVAIGAIVSTIQDSSTYASFAQAKDNPEIEFHVIGELNKEKEMDYNPEINPNMFSFYAFDKEGEEYKVVFNGTKPQDFERSEQLVMLGSVQEDVFVCSKILMKCPSKYNDGQEEVIVTANAVEANS